MQAFSRGIKLCRDFAPLWRQIGVSLSEEGDYSSALEAFTEALAKDHVCPLTWNALGITFMRVHSLDAAQLCFETILSGDRKNPIREYEPGTLATDQRAQTSVVSTDVLPEQFYGANRGTLSH